MSNSYWFICNSKYINIPPQRKPVHWVGALIPGCLRFRSVTVFPLSGDCMSSVLQRCWPNALCLIVEIRVSLYYTSSHWPKQNGGESIFSKLFVNPRNQLYILQDFALYTPSFKCSNTSYCCEMKYTTWGYTSTSALNLILYIEIFC